MSSDLDIERQRLARRLENDILPSLTLILSQVRAYQYTFQDDPAVQQAMNLLNTLITQSITRVRDLQTNLNPTVLEDLGLPAALETLAAQFHRTDGLIIKLNHQWIDRRFSPLIERILYSVVHALLDDAAASNIVHITLSLKHEHDVLTLSYRDETAHPQPDAIKRYREWVEAAGGQMQVATQPGVSQQITCRFVVEEANPLTSRETEILQLVVDGLTNQEIAVQLEISPRTVSFHLSNIYSQLNISTRTEAAVIALAKGWALNPE